MTKVILADADAVARVIPTVSIIEVTAVALEARVLRGGVQSQDLDDGGRLHMGLTESAFVEHADNELLICEAQFDAKGSVVEGAGEEGGSDVLVPFAIVKATFRVAYSRRPTKVVPTKKDLASFALSNAVFNAWPYWREYLSSSLVRLGVPSFTLPMLVVQPRQKRGSVEKKARIEPGAVGAPVKGDAQPK